MVEGVEWLARPLNMLLRMLLWLCWELCVEIICWSIGWVVCRTLTFGKLPNVKLSEIDSLHWAEALVVEMIGLATLASLIYPLVDLI